MSNTGYKNISYDKRNNRYTLHLAGALGLEQKKMSSRSLLTLIYKRNEIYDDDFGEEIPDEKDIIEMPINPNIIDPDDVWDRAIAAQEIQEGKNYNAYFPIRIQSTRPIGIAFTSDEHMGSPYTDYRTLRQHAEIIANTDGLYLMCLGDERDNFVGGKLTHARFTTSMSVPEELAIYQAWVDTVKHKLLAYISGNHDLWTFRSSGIDLAQVVIPRRVLYDQQEIRLAVQFNGHEWKMRMRHRWPRKSMYNPTHGIESDYMNAPFDIGMGGDYHDGTMCREFVREGKRRYAILLGTYKNLGDEFFRMINKQQSPHVGSGVMIFFPDGTTEWHHHTPRAAEYLRWLREGYECE